MDSNNSGNDLRRLGEISVCRSEASLIFVTTAVRAVAFIDRRLELLVNRARMILHLKQSADTRASR